MVISFDPKLWLSSGHNTRTRNIYRKYKHKLESSLFYIKIYKIALKCMFYKPCTSNFRHPYSNDPVKADGSIYKCRKNREEISSHSITFGRFPLTGSEQLGVAFESHT
jgi:hypothetical protein